jgi:RNA polymerase sigma-70 factor (ECF subfamily)
LVRTVRASRSQQSAVSVALLGAEFSPVVDSRPMNPSEREPSYSQETRSNADDVALIRRMVEADETALGALYDRWVKSLYSLVMHLLQDPDEAEDVVEETFWQAWRKASSYEPSKGAVSTWLLTIGRRKALDRIRSRRRYKEDAVGRDKIFADLAAPGLDPSEQTEGSELRTHVRAALKELPAEQREVLELGYFDGLSQTEIADVTRQPLGTVKTRMRLAMQKLREPLSMHRRVTE